MKKVVPRKNYRFDETGFKVWSLCKRAIGSRNFFVLRVLKYVTKMRVYIVSRSRRRISSLKIQKETK